MAVVGSSGSGKSTLLHLLGGLDVHYAGEVEVGGVKLRGLKDQALARFRNTHVGFVFQSFHLIPNLSAVENVLLPAHFGPVTAEARKRAEFLLDRVGLLAKKAREPVRLSGGERQRVAIARALFTGPKVLLCDEPTGNLDAATGEGVIQLFEELHREGLTVLAVTHEERMRSAARRVLRLKEGRLLEEPGAERPSVGGVP
ncbi:ABC transporter, ATP-binding protein [Stigmatella aurantiaca DW4/3-1]|uniref:ABC transporter, ATP-binding protein n=1 Tax=Stigmatella aurantiaca (strain DW4/3-1) TaxID=378806 RepID=Q098S6_STIAD|nr:ABC transporter, ATP-binding protein [Stigmatella aurantiaca DW4/3-1]